MASDKPASVGTIGTAPTGGTVVLTSPSTVVYPDFHLTFTLTDAIVPITDAAGSGSYGALTLFTFNEGVIAFDGCRQNYTAFTEDAALTTAAGDAVFDIGIGSVAIAAAADGALATTDDDIGTEVGPLTMSSGTGTGSGFAGAPILDGSTTAVLLALNISGTAATIDATGEIGVTGTITVSGTFLGDD